MTSKEADDIFFKPFEHISLVVTISISRKKITVNHVFQGSYFKETDNKIMDFLLYSVVSDHRVFYNLKFT